MRVLAGTGQEGREDGARAAASFYEPGGVSATQDMLYVADTNNHAIRRISLADDVVDTLFVRLG